MIGEERFISDERLATLVEDANALDSAGGTIAVSAKEVADLRAALFELQTRRSAAKLVNQPTQVKFPR